MRRAMLPEEMEKIIIKDVEGHTETDEELRKILESRKAEIKVVGVGGAGGNTVSRMMQIGIVGAETVAMNTDAQDLLYTDADKKVLIGKELTGGLGAGADFVDHLQMILVGDGAFDEHEVHVLRIFFDVGERGEDEVGLLGALARARIQLDDH
jgi:hypothetical protein